MVKHLLKFLLRSKPTVWDGDISQINRPQYLRPCSEPTVWDGDAYDVNSFDQSIKVPSPLCGMVTESCPLGALSPAGVLSPPCGIVCENNAPVKS